MYLEVSERFHTSWQILKIATVMLDRIEKGVQNGGG